MKKYKYAFRFYAILAGLVILTGCGEKLPPDIPDLFPASLVVSQDGGPLEDATVQLVPEQANSRWSAVGKTDAQGKVSFFTDGRYKGVPAGKYTVTVFKVFTEPAKYSGSKPDDVDYPTWQRLISQPRKSYRLVDTKYESAETSPVKIEVGPKIQQSPIDVGKAIKELVK